MVCAMRVSILVLCLAACAHATTPRDREVGATQRVPILERGVRALRAP